MRNDWWAGLGCNTTPHIPEDSSLKTKRREKIKPYTQMETLTDCLRGWRGERIERNVKCLLYHTLPGGWGEVTKKVDGSRDLHVSEGCLASGWIWMPAVHLLVDSTLFTVSPLNHPYISWVRKGGRGGEGGCIEIHLDRYRGGYPDVKGCWKQVHCQAYNDLLYPCYSERIISLSSPPGIEMRFTYTNKRTLNKGIGSFCRQTIVE